MACTHPQNKVRFLACSAADRFPGVWVCDECNIALNFDPSGKVKVRYLDHPNPSQTKVSSELKTSGP